MIRNTPYTFQRKTKFHINSLFTNYTKQSSRVPTFRAKRDSPFDCYSLKSYYSIKISNYFLALYKESNNFIQREKGGRIQGIQLSTRLSPRLPPSPPLPGNILSTWNDFHSISPSAKMGSFLHEDEMNFASGRKSNVPLGRGDRIPFAWKTLRKEEYRIIYNITYSRYKTLFYQTLLLILYYNFLMNNEWRLKPVGSHLGSLRIMTLTTYVKIKVIRAPLTTL